MADLQVDLDGLDALAGTLRRIGSRLDGARSELRGAAGDLGDEQVAGALERFESRWRDGRQDIAENGEALSSMLTESARTYRQTDRELSSAVQGAVARGTVAR